MADSSVLEARERLRARFAKAGGGGATDRVGGSMRRKTKKVHKAASADDKKLQSTLKRLGVNTIPAIEEVNLFKDDGNVIHFDNPRVQASIAANTYVVSGKGETKSMQDLLPGILSQLGSDSLTQLKKLTETLQSRAAQAGAKESDVAPEDIPEDFEAAAKE